MKIFSAILALLFALFSAVIARPLDLLSSQEEDTTAITTSSAAVGRALGRHRPPGFTRILLDDDEEDEEEDSEDDKGDDPDTDKDEFDDEIDDMSGPEDDDCEDGIYGAETRPNYVFTTGSVLSTKSKIKNLNACAKECARSSKCNTFNYDKKGKKCKMFKEKFSSKRKTKKVKDQAAGFVECITDMK